MRPILQQDEVIGAALRRRERVEDVDPSTGEPVRAAGDVVEPVGSVG